MDLLCAFASWREHQSPGVEKPLFSHRGTGSWANHKSGRLRIPPRLRVSARESWFRLGKPGCSRGGAETRRKPYKSSSCLPLVSPFREIRASAGTKRSLSPRRKGAKEGLPDGSSLRLRVLARASVFWCGKTPDLSQGPGVVGKPQKRPASHSSAPPRLCERIVVSVGKTRMLSRRRGETTEAYGPALLRACASPRENRGVPAGKARCSPESSPDRPRPALSGAPGGNPADIRL
jgi:hypothetical protein